MSLNSLFSMIIKLVLFEFLCSSSSFSTLHATTGVRDTSVYWEYRAMDTHFIASYLHQLEQQTGRISLGVARRWAIWGLDNGTNNGLESRDPHRNSPCSGEARRLTQYSVLAGCTLYKIFHRKRMKTKRKKRMAKAISNFVSHDKLILKHSSH